MNYTRCQRCRQLDSLMAVMAMVVVEVVAAAVAVEVVVAAAGEVVVVMMTALVQINTDFGRRGVLFITNY